MKLPIVITIVLVLMAVSVHAASHFHDNRQQSEIDRMEERRRVAELQFAQAEELIVAEAASAEQAEATLARWRSRYKYIPSSLKTADMVEYIESLTRDGFEQFDLRLASESDHGDYHSRTYTVNGTAFYRSFYRLLWHIENNREFYRIDDLKVRHTNVFRRNVGTGLDRRYDMVAFSFKLTAFYSTMPGISPPDEDLRPIPLAVLQSRTPPADTFTPLIRTDLPPNDEQLLDVESARLISIVGTQAVFEDRYGRHIVMEGDRIYLGEIVAIDPVNAFVRVRLNKGDRVETMNIRVAGADEANTFRTPSGNEIQIISPQGQ